MAETVATVAIGTTLYTQIYILFDYHLSTLPLPWLGGFQIYFSRLHLESSYTRILGESRVANIAWGEYCICHKTHQ